jgi:hypothetical protein
MENLLLVAITAQKPQITVKKIESMSKVDDFTVLVEQNNIKLLNDGFYVFDIEKELLTFVSMDAGKYHSEVDMSDFTKFLEFNSKYNHFTALLAWWYYKFEDIYTEMPWEEYHKAMRNIESGLVKEIVANDIEVVLFEDGPETDGLCYLDTLNPTDYFFEEFKHYGNDDGFFLDLYDAFAMCRLSGSNPSVNTKTFFTPIDLTEL